MFPIELPEAGGPVIERSEGGVFAFAFRQDEAILRQVDQGLAFSSVTCRGSLTVVPTTLVAPY